MQPRYEWSVDAWVPVQLARPLQEVPERWWYRSSVNDAEARVCTQFEPKKHMVVRVVLCLCWTHGLPPAL